MRKLGAFVVGFYNPDEAMVHWEKYAEAFPSDTLATLALSLFALRVWNNLGKGGEPLAVISTGTLGALQEQSDLRQVLGLARKFPRPGDPEGPEFFKLARNSVFEAESFLNTRIADRPALRLTDSGTPRRRFEGTVEERGDHFTLELKVKGFGLFGSGLNYYAPVAIYPLLYHLVNMRTGEPRFLERLAEVARRTAIIWASGQIGMGEEGPAATAIVAQTREFE